MPTRGIRGEELAELLLEMSDELEGRFRREFLQQVAALSNNKSLKQLLDDIETGAYESGDPIDVRLNRVSIDTSKLDEVMRNAIARSAKITRETVGLQGAFSVVNPEVINAARNLSVQLSTNLNTTARQTIRQIITDAVEGNITRVDAANKIRRLVGLIPQHAIAVDNYLNKMLADGVKQSVAKKRAEKYAERLLRYRANTIARTEIARAVGTGQTEYWKQMRSEGFLPPEARRVWITAQDEKVCKICGPMDGVLADIDGFFDTSAGPSEYPQASHPNCRCTAGITIVKQKKKSAISKEESLSFAHWLLSKANPYKDAQGRFTTKTKAVSPRIKRPAMRRSGGNKTQSNPASGASGLPRFSSPSRSRQVMKLVKRGSSVLLGKRDAKTGVAQPLSESDAGKRYGTTPAEIKKSIEKLGVKSVTVAGSYLSRESYRKEITIAQMQATAQAVEEAKRMGIPVDKLSISFVRKTTEGSASGTYSPLDRQKIGIDEASGTPIGRITLTTSGLSSLDYYFDRGKFKSNQYLVSDNYVLDAKSQKDASRRGAYALAIHEIGHHYTLWREDPPASVPARTVFDNPSAVKRAPAGYARTNTAEFMAESFTAWWLFAGSKGKFGSYYKRWSYGAATVLNGGDVYAKSKGVLPQYEREIKTYYEARPFFYQLLKSDGGISIYIQNLPPYHPIIVYMTNGDSLDISGQGSD